MSYFCVIQQPSTLPYVIKIEEETTTAAMSMLDEKDAEIFISPLFLFGEDGSVARVVRTEQGFSLSNSAFKELGSETPDSYFTQAETMEADTCD